MKTILVVEDDKTLRNFIIDLLTENDYITQFATNGIEALEKAEKYRPDMVILDLGLPKLDGESVCRDLKKQYPEMPVIILTGKSSSDEIVTGFEIGADDYITKPFDSDVLIARVNVRLKAASATGIFEIKNIKINTKTHEVFKDEEMVELTPKEFRLLEYFINNKNRVLTRDMILNKIWDNAYDVESRVVDIYIGFLRKKLGSKNTNFIKSVRGFGYMLKED